MRTSLLLAALLLAACGGDGAVPAGDAFAADDTIVMDEGAPQAIAVLANVSGLESVAVIDAPRRGSAIVDANDHVVYEPDSGFNGTDTLTYRAEDSAGFEHTATVTVTVYQSVGATGPIVLLPRTSIQPEEVAVLVNDDDPQSVAVAAYYVEQRRIPDANVIHLRFTPGGTVMSADDFAPLYAQAEAAAGSAMQAYVITWTLPYRVEGMSISSAFALGYDEKYFDTNPCNSTEPVDYYRSDSSRPFTDHGIRPAMVLAGTNEDDVRALIDRGVAADHTFPTGTGYFLSLIHI